MEQLEFINRVATDKDFRDKLRQDPKAALAQSGEDTGDVQIKVVQDTASVRHITMPYNPNDLLNDSSLEEISGGCWRPVEGFSRSGKASSLACIGRSTLSSVEILDRRG